MLVVYLKMPSIKYAYFHYKIVCFYICVMEIPIPRMMIILEQVLALLCGRNRPHNRPIQVNGLMQKGFYQWNDVCFISSHRINAVWSTIGCVIVTYDFRKAGDTFVWRRHTNIEVCIISIRWVHGRLVVVMVIEMKRRHFFVEMGTSSINYLAMGLLPDTQNRGCACAGNAGNVFPVTAGKRSRHASRHVLTHVPWCMPGSLTSSFLWNRRRGETFPAFPAHAHPAILRIW